MQESPLTRACSLEELGFVVIKAYLVHVVARPSHCLAMTGGRGSRNGVRSVRGIAMGQGVVAWDDEMDMGP